MEELEGEYNDIIGELDQILLSSSKPTATEQKSEHKQKREPERRSPLPAVSPALPLPPVAVASEQEEERRGWGAWLSEGAASLLSTPSSVPIPLLATPESVAESAKQRESFAAFRDSNRTKEVLLHIDAGARVTVPFVLKPNFALNWQFQVQHFDIEFKVLLRKAAAGGAVEKALRVQKVNAGKICFGGVLPSTSSSPRHISLCFDNTASRIRPKTVSYVALMGTELVFDVDVDDNGSLIKVDEEAGADEDFDAARPAEKGGVNDVIKRLGSKARKVVKSLQLHDSDDQNLGMNDDDADEDDGPPLISPELVESVKAHASHASSIIGEGLLKITSEAVRVAKRFQLHDASDNDAAASSSAAPVPPTPAPPHQGPPVVPPPGNVATFMCDVVEPRPAENISQWASAERFSSSSSSSSSAASSAAASTITQQPQVPTPAPRSTAGPLLLNPDRTIEPAAFEALWLDLESTPGLELTVAVTPLAPTTDSGLAQTLVAHLEETGFLVLAQGSIGDSSGLKLFLFAEGLPLPLTTPARRHVQFLAELSLVQIPSKAFLLSLSGRSPEYRYVDEFALSMRLREVVSAFDDGTRGRGVACARLGLEYF